MRLAVVGASKHSALHQVRDFVLALPSDASIVSGHAQGVDIVAEITAAQRGLDVTSFPARWHRADGSVDRGAGIARNADIAQLADEGDAFLWPGCKGTINTIQRLQKLGKPVRVHEPELAEKGLLLHTAAHGYAGPGALDITARSTSELGRRFAPSARLHRDATALLKRAVAYMNTMTSLPADADVGRAELLAKAVGVREAAWAWFAPRYQQEMRVLWRRDMRAFTDVLASAHLVLRCACPRYERCHRGLLVNLLLGAGAGLGVRVVDGGEVVVPAISAACDGPR
jgi:hypothetical protein